MKYLVLKFSPKDLGAKVFFSNLVLLCGREEKYVKPLGHWRHFTRGNCIGLALFFYTLTCKPQEKQFCMTIHIYQLHATTDSKNEAKLLYESLKLGIKISGICYNTGKYY